MLFIPIELCNADNPTAVLLPDVIAPFNALYPTAVFPLAEVIACRALNPRPTFVNPEVKEGKEDPKTRLLSPKSKVNCPAVPTNKGVEFAVLIFIFPAIGEIGPPVFPVKVSISPVDKAETYPFAVTENCALLKDAKPALFWVAGGLARAVAT